MFSVVHAVIAGAVFLNLSRVFIFLETKNSKVFEYLLVASFRSRILFNTVSLDFLGYFFEGEGDESGPFRGQKSVSKRNLTDF